MAAGEAQRILLSAADPPPVRVTNREGGSKFLLVGDHAGNCVPAALGNLGLGAADLARHIAIDSGVSALGVALSEALDAPFIEQRYSRLVIDCNRWPDAEDSIAGTSDGTAIVPNQTASAEQRAQRHDEVFAPYQREIAASIARREDAGLPVVLIALHSFTPVLGGHERPWDIGVLHDAGDPAFALALLAELQAAGGWRIGDNQPYAMNAIDYTVPHHAYPRRLPYAELEVRADRIADAAGVTTITGVLARALARAAEVALRGAL